MPGMDAIEHFTPPVEQLLPFQQLQCSEPNCNAIFTNSANFEMHLERRHKVQRQRLRNADDAKQRLYHCPQQMCTYHCAENNSERYFKSLKYLRQHYQKVHAKRTQLCERCGEEFITAGLLQSHLDYKCGRWFACGECDCCYKSREALLTHAKRKGHAVASPKHQWSKSRNSKSAIPPTPTTCAPKVAIPRLSIKPKMQHQQTQTETEHLYDVPAKRLCIAATQTSEVPLPYYADMATSMTNIALSTEDLDDLQSLLRDIETQTEQTLPSATTPAQTQPTADLNDDDCLLDQMFAQSTHMYTQTCDDLLRELGLADIQTQTQWPESPPPTSESPSQPQYTSTATSTTCGNDADLFVSTETQTGFMLPDHLFDSPHMTDADADRM